MRRLLLSSLAAMLLAGSARADVDFLTMWLADEADGDGHVVIDGVSNTGVVQLWMEVPADMRLLTADAILVGYDAAWGKNLSFEVQGFHDIVIPDSLLQRSARGSIEDDVPHGFIDDYGYGGEDANFPLGGYSGLLGPRTVLLDEIVVRGTGITASSPDLVYRAFLVEPSSFELVFQPLPPPGQWIIVALPYVAHWLNGTFSNPFLVETVPEPGPLTLLVLGGLTVARRRGSRGR